MYRDDSRASFEFDTQLNKFKSVSFEMIKKQKCNDLNIKSGKSFVFDEDVRISFNIEHKIHQMEMSALPYNIKFERDKERTSFKIGWL